MTICAKIIPFTAINSRCILVHILISSRTLCLIKMSSFALLVVVILGWLL